MVLVCELVKELQHIEQLAKLQVTSGFSKKHVASEQCDTVMARTTLPWFSRRRWATLQPPSVGAMNNEWTSWPR